MFLKVALFEALKLANWNLKKIKGLREIAAPFSYSRIVAERWDR